MSNDDYQQTCRQSRPHQLLRQQLVARLFDTSKEIEHVQFVSTCQKDEKIVRRVAKKGNTSNGNIQHVEAKFDKLLRHVEFDLLLRHVAGVDGALC